jgi:hypothetical protein
MPTPAPRKPGTPVAAKPGAKSSAQIAPKAAAKPPGRYASHRAQITTEAEDASPLREWVAPIALLSIGLILRVIQVTAYRPEKMALAMVAVIAVLGFAFAFAGTLAGLFGIASFMGTELESPPAMARKVAAVAMLTSAAAVLMASFERDPREVRGVLVAVHGALLLYFMLLAFLFKLDLLEALVAAVIATVATIGLLLVASQALPAPYGRAMVYGV